MKKSLKKQAVFPVLMLLVVTALALIGSSFAWFSMSTTASVTTVSGTIEDSSVGLMISQDATNFKSEVTLGASAATFVNPYRFHQMSSKDGQNFFEATITQKNADGTAAEIYTTELAKTPKAPATGKLAGYYTVNDNDTNLASGANSATVGDPAVTYYNEVGYMVFDLFFEVEAASDLYLNKGTTFSAGTGNNAMRVAFIPYGGTAIGNNNAATVAANAIALNTAGTPVIWNPTAADDASADYYGIKAESTSTTKFAPYAQHNTYTGDAVNAKSSADLWREASAFTDTDTMTGYTPLMSLIAGVNKLRVVVWLEGNDASCTTQVAKLQISFALNFFAKATASQQQNG